MLEEINDEIKEEIKEEEIIVSKKKEVKLGKLVSRLNHPVYIAYNGDTLVMAPRAKVKKVNKQLLGALPKGVKFIDG